MGMQRAENGKCPEGFLFIYGNICIEESAELTLKEVMDYAQEEVRGITCESAVSALQELAGWAEGATSLVQNAVRTAKSLVSLPFEKLKGVISTVLDQLDEITRFLDEVLEIWTGLSGDRIAAVKDALESLVACPIIKATPFGQQVDAILRGLDTMTDEIFEESIRGLKSTLSKQAEGQLDAMKAGPIKTLDNLDKKYREYIDSLGVDDTLQKLRDLADCLEKACRMANESAEAYDLWKKSRGITDPAVLEEKLGATYDAATGKFSYALSQGTGAAETSMQETIGAYRKLEDYLPKEKPAENAPAQGA